MFYLDRVDLMTRERRQDIAREVARDRLIREATGARTVRRVPLRDLLALLRRRFTTAYRSGPPASVAPLPLRRGGRLRAVHQ